MSGFTRRRCGRCKMKRNHRRREDGALACTACGMVATKPEPTPAPAAPLTGRQKRNRRRSAKRQRRRVEIGRAMGKAAALDRAFRRAVRGD